MIYFDLLLRIYLFMLRFREIYSFLFFFNFFLTFISCYDRLLKRLQVQFSGRTLAFQAGFEGPIPFTCSICFHSSAGQSNALLRQRSKVRILLGAPCGGRSSVGRTPDCGSGGQGFDPLRSPHIICPGGFDGVSPSGKALDSDSNIAQVRILPPQPKAKNCA